MNSLEILKKDLPKILHLLPVFLVVAFVYASVNISWGVVLPILFNKTVIQVSESADASFWFGCFAGIYSLGQLLSYNAVGILSDHIGRKRVMVVSLFLFAFSHIVLALSVYSGQFTWILLARFLSGLFANYINIGQSMIFDYVEENERKRFLNYYYIFANLPFALVPLFFSLTLYQDMATQPKWVLITPFVIVAALITLLSIWISLFYRDRFQRPDQTTNQLSLHFYRERLRDKQALQQYTINILVFSAMAIFYTAYPILLLSEFDFSMEAQGSVVAINNTICMTLALFVIPKIVTTISAEKLINTALRILCIASISMCLMKPLAMYLSLQLLQCICFCLLLPLCVDQIAKSVPQHNQCKNLSINQSLKLITKITLPPLAGYWVTNYGMGVWVYIGAVALATVLFKYSLTVKSSKQTIMS